VQQPQLLLEGKYEILAKIREGGMGTIYRVRHRLLDEVRVIKVMQPHVVADADLKRRFLEEAKTAIRLKHPNICTIHDFAVEDNGTAYLVMEYIDGVNLADLQRSRGAPGVPLSLEVAHQALLALGYLHRKGVIHRDVAPDNLMLTHDEEGGPVVKLIDLGIAKTTNRAMDMTATGVFLGKIKYASPEQYGTLGAGEKLDGRSDLYGLGVVLYELLTGVRPFPGESPAELLRAHLFTAPTPFSQTDPDGKVPPEVRAVVLKALEKKREDRYATAEEFDREIVTLRERLARPEDIESTMAMLSVLRSTQPATADNVTPSAQDRLDRQFGPLTTPSPSAPALMIVPGATQETTAVDTGPKKAGLQPASTQAVHPPGPPPDHTAIDPIAAAERASAAAARPAGAKPGKAAPAPPSRPAPLDAEAKKTEALRVDAKQVSPGAARSPVPAAPRAGKRLPLWAALGAAIVALLVWRPWAQRHPAGEQAEEPAAKQSAAAPEQVRPTEPAAAQPEPTAAPTAAPPTERPARSEAPRPDWAAAEKARKEASALRRAAERAGAARLALPTYRRGVARQAEGDKLLADLADREARAVFDSAAELFAEAEAGALSVARSPTALRVAELPTAFARPSPQPPIATAPPPTAAPTAPRPEATRPSVVESQAAPPASAPAGKGSPVEERRIRDMMRSYERAWSTFDARLYSKVYPSGVDAFELALKNLRSQYVRIEIQRIDLDPTATRANVIGHETIVATPKAGNQVQNDQDVTLHVEKRGDVWVITGRD